jgi:hypothetical protein
MVGRHPALAFGLLARENFFVVCDSRRRSDGTHGAGRGDQHHSGPEPAAASLQQAVRSFSQHRCRSRSARGLVDQALLRLFPGPVRVNGRLVLVGDGIKIGMRGKKMPGVGVRVATAIRIQRSAVA